MNIIEALGLCKSGHKVRPVCWRTLNAGHWVESIPTPCHSEPCVFVEAGTLEEMPHALRLSLPPEFLGDWEVVDG